MKVKNNFCLEVDQEL